MNILEIKTIAINLPNAEKDIPVDVTFKQGVKVLGF